MRFKNAVVSIGLLIGIGVLGGCAKPHIADVSPPGWDQLASGAYRAEGGRVFYGIGKATGLRSATLLRATADNQAKSEAGRIIVSYLNSLTRAAGLDPANDRVREAAGILTETILEQARISDHRYETPGGPLFSLCRIELSSVKQAIRGAGWMEESLRQRLLSRADDVFAAFSLK